MKTKNSLLFIFSLVLLSTMENTVIAQKPLPYFYVSDTTPFCTPKCISFYDYSTNTPTSWSWSFPGATPSSSNVKNPTNICYNTPGTYDVKLVVTNSSGSDSLTRFQFIKCSSPPSTPTITSSGDTLFASPAPSYQWYYNNSPIPGATDSFYVATQQGSYTVKATNVYCYSISSPFYVCKLSLSLQSIKYTTCGTCNDGQATVTTSNGTGPYTVTWYTSPLQNGFKATNLPTGTYSVCAMDANGCTACLSGVVIDTMNCTGFSVTSTTTNATCSSCFNGTASATAVGGTAPFTYKWSPSNRTTSSITGLAAGSYSVCITDYTGCTTCALAIVNANNCSAYFNVNPDTIPHSYIGINMASGTPPISYSWQWGDGNSDTTAYPTHTYATSGYYKICLHISDGAGCVTDSCASYYLLRTSDGSTAMSMAYIRIVPPTATGVADVSSFEKSFALFPNPAKNEFTVVNPLKADNASLNVYDMVGLNVYDMVGSRIYSTIMNGSQKTINCSQWPSGIYFIRVEGNGNAGVVKMVKMD